MSSHLFWHGTPADVASSEIAPRPSFFEGVWLSSAQEVAAHYAGMDGWIHGFMPAADARLLQATGHRDKPMPYAYPDAPTWEAVRQYLSDVERADLDCFDCLDECKIANGFMPPLGADGQPAWEALFHDLAEMPGMHEAILPLVGVGGVLQSERADLALGDRRGDAGDPLHAALVKRLKAVGSEPVLTLGMLRAESLVPVCRLPARQVTMAFLAGHGMPRATASDLARWVVEPMAEPTAGLNP